MAELERIYTIPLRNVKKTPRWKRAKRATMEVRCYLEKHMKTEASSIKIDKTINEKLWERGSSKPPSKIRVRAVKLGDGVVETELST
ncbi:MAG: large subunit ribosomal protein L31e [Candidatus Argoarchaeum ethanivorans]|uniref:Large ribosomal subunit protein eL31 n=1 Tax=Candidatus Argoarchaeum ethanivorans TaxID=2608793 RepID=A0A8B3S6I0_9EURY|nr:MAG: large subunit ribosomal protein L31e [Candidatus Argoarchaeum ethanivorans]